MSTPHDAAREQSRQVDEKFGAQPQGRAETATLAPPRRLGVDAGERVDQAMPDAKDDVYTPTPELSAVDGHRVRQLNQAVGPGPHLDQLSDTERSALMVHVARIDGVIARHEGGTAMADDYSADPDIMAELHDAFAHRGSRSPDDPSEVDYEMLSDIAVDELRDVRKEWLLYAEAVSSARPVI